MWYIYMVLLPSTTICYTHWTTQYYTTLPWHHLPILCGWLWEGWVETEAEWMRVGLVGLCWCWTSRGCLCRDGSDERGTDTLKTERPPFTGTLTGTWLHLFCWLSFFWTPPRRTLPFPLPTVMKDSTFSEGSLAPLELGTKLQTIVSWNWQWWYATHQTWRSLYKTIDSSSSCSAQLRSRINIR